MEFVNLSHSNQRPSILIGMDVGSTTVKAVAVDQRSDEILWQDYQRHETKLGEKVFEFLERMEKDLGVSESNSRIFFTGSGGSNLAKLVGGRFVQEVSAVSMAVEKIFPEVYSVIELGGQDSKIIVYRDQPGSTGRKKIASMNDKCAGGTGAVLDKIRAKLNIPPEMLSYQCYDGIRRHRVAGKCGVFSETDINSLQKQGIPTDELMASLFEAIVLQNLTVLTRGHTLHPHILLLGGPNRFVRGLQEAWRDHLPRLWQERGVLVPDNCPVSDLIRAPENGHYFGSLGAIEFGLAQEEGIGVYKGLKHLEHYLNEGNSKIRASSAVPSIRGSDSELQTFRRKYYQPDFIPPAYPESGSVEAFLGIDGGSTSTKAVLLSREGSVLAKAYRLSRGNPIQDTVFLLAQLKSDVEANGAQLKILGVATTGYAKDVLQKILKADLALVETVAHARSAIHHYGKPDVIVDVGGQDIKLIILKDGHVKDFMLNTQCSAGNGYFLQATAASFGLEVEQYADTAFQAAVMPEFSYGCAVFLQSDIVNYQRQGWKSGELLSGLAAVLPKNIWLYVAKIPNLSTLGTRFILQGGTQRNLAAVKAQVDYIHKRFERFSQTPDVIVHEHCGEAGAIGAALEVRRVFRNGKETGFIGFDAVSKIQYRTTTDETTRCNFCTNQCLRTFIDYRTDGVDLSEDCRIAEAAVKGSEIPLREGEDRLIISTCEKGQVQDVNDLRGILSRLKKNARENPDLVDRAAKTAWKPTRPESVADLLPGRAWTRQSRQRRDAMLKRGQIRIGVPRILNLYSYMPFFSGYLESLGVDYRNIVYSDFTTDELYREGTRRGSIDPCFPAKVATAHVYNLFYKHHKRKPIDYIFSPMMDVLETPLVNTRGSNACTTVIQTPQTVRAAFTKENDVFMEHGLVYLNPLIDLENRKLLTRQLFLTWESILGLSEAENRRAVEQGFQALERWNSGLRKEAREILDTLEKEKRLGIVMLGRSYHHDPGLNHGIFEEFQKLGYPVFSQGTLPFDEDLLERLFGDEVKAGIIEHPLDITDVWKQPYIASTSLKLWAAKFVARHPNLVAVEISNFKCGHDAPVYQTIEKIIECAGRPYFAFKDLDENKPSGSFRVRIETIHYFLQQYKSRLA